MKCLRQDFKIFDELNENIDILSVIKINEEALRYVSLAALYV